MLSAPSELHVAFDSAGTGHYSHFAFPKTFGFGHYDARNSWNDFASARVYFLQIETLAPSGPGNWSKIVPIVFSAAITRYLIATAI